MGSLTLASATLPFMTARHYEQACSIIEAVIARLASEGRHFTGIMNSGFFATAEGVKVIEFNARFGDPECMNIMTLFEGSWTGVMESICAGTLAPPDVALRAQASVVLYLVSPDYALAGSGGQYEFELDERAFEERGVHVFFSSAVRAGARAYRTVGTSRVLALAAAAPALSEAREQVVSCAERVPLLEWRRDVGDPRYLESLRRLVERSAPLAGTPPR
jgi:phosphoribosylamine--glycine ligase